MCGRRSATASPPKKSPKCCSKPASTPACPSRIGPCRSLRKRSTGWTKAPRGVPRSLDRLGSVPYCLSTEHLFALRTSGASGRDDEGALMRRSTRTLAVLAVSALVLAACGGGSETETTASGETKLTVGVIPIVDTAPIWLGKEKGFFKDEGIDLELTKTTGGAAAVPGVINGEFDFAFGNIVSLMVAQDQGLPLEFVTNGTTTAGESGKDFSGVVVNADSDIKSPADLAGETVSVNNLKNIGDTTIRHVVEADGGDPSKIKFAEVPFPDAPAALENGDVDAAWILEPFLSTAIANGARVVSWNYVETSPELDIAGYFTKTDTVTVSYTHLRAHETVLDL